MSDLRLDVEPEFKRPALRARVRITPEMLARPHEDFADFAAQKIREAVVGLHYLLWQPFWPPLDVCARFPGPERFV